MGAWREQGGNAAPWIKGFAGALPERYRLAEEEYGALNGFFNTCSALLLNVSI